MDIKIRAVIFDLDGVIVSTDEYHYQAWKNIADEQHIDFNREINNRLRGVSRMVSLNIILEKANRTYTESEKLRLANRKNELYKSLLSKLTSNDLFPGAIEIPRKLKEKGFLIAIGSSSKNATYILKQLGLDGIFDTVSSGNNITHSKPNPEVFLKAAEMLGVSPRECAVVEDAVTGIDACLIHRPLIRKSFKQR